MNEFEALKEMLATPPATAETRAQGRERLHAALRRPAPAGPRRIRWITGGLTVTAAGVVAVLTVTGVGTPDTAAPNSPPATGLPPAAGPEVLTAPEVLSAAATTVSVQPSKGSYWRVATSGIIGRRDTGRGYTISSSMKQTLWLSASPSGTSRRILQFTGWTPETAEDQAKWRADGSPTSWRFKIDPRICPRKTKRHPCEEVLTTKDGRVEVLKIGGPGVVGELGGRPVTIARLKTLPENPAGLRRALAATLPDQKDPMLDTIVYEIGMLLVTDLPVPSKLRGATYRMMATLPGVKAVGVVADPLGRKGQAITMGADGSTKVLNRVIFDPATGLPLSIQTIKKGATVPSSDKTVLSAAWTDAEPDLTRP